MLTRVLAIAALIALLTVPGLSAHAQGTGLTLRPVKVSETLTPGSSVKGTIYLSNASEDDIEVEVNVEDFIPTAGAEGVQFVGRAPGVTTVRDWVTIEGDKTFVFRRGESREITYTITAPPDAEPGGHFGVAFFKATRLADKENQLKVGTQVGMLILITVPGNRLQKGRILDFIAPAFVQKGPVEFEISFENTGTVHFEPKGTISIRNMFGKEVGIVPIEGQVVLPTGVKRLLFHWAPDRLILGRYTALATVEDGEGNVLTSEQVSFYAAPLWYVGALALTVVSLSFLIRFLRRRVRISVSLRE